MEGVDAEKVPFELGWEFLGGGLRAEKAARATRARGDGVALAAAPSTRFKIAAPPVQPGVGWRDHRRTVTEQPTIDCSPPIIGVVTAANRHRLSWWTTTVQLRTQRFTLFAHLS